MFTLDAGYFLLHFLRLTDNEREPFFIHFLINRLRWTFVYDFEPLREDLRDLREDLRDLREDLRDFEPLREDLRGLDFLRADCLRDFFHCFINSSAFLLLTDFWIRSLDRLASPECTSDMMFLAELDKRGPSPACTSDMTLLAELDKRCERLLRLLGFLDLLGLARLPREDRIRPDDCLRQFLDFFLRVAFFAITS